jgi:uncharacterized protein YyaL (SSP411 family)
MSITWSPWSADAFARARGESKPVLLFISAAWCHWCEEMDRTSYADPAIQRLINEGFVAVRVDADKRPDIHERYGLGGLPTTAFLTADGDVLGGGTYVPIGRMPLVLEQVTRAFSSRREEIAERAQALADRPTESGGTPVSADVLLAGVLDAYDSQHGGFGVAPKFPLTAPLHLAIRLHEESPDSSGSLTRDIVEHTLDAMAGGGLYDEVDGGFFRYAATRDWQSPRQEKLLDVNAALLRLYVDAAAVFGLARYRERVVDVLRYAQTWLADPVDGGWAGSQRADDLYYSLDAHERSRTTAPLVDRTLYTGWNAAMASAVLRAAQLLDDSELGRFALKSLERLLLACYQPGGGVAHYFDGAAHVRGLLDDQVLMATGALDAAEATGNITYEMMAEELAQYALRTMWDEQAGGFFDRVPSDGTDGIGRLRRPVKPFVSNCEAARLLVRLAAASGHHELRTSAEATLGSMAVVASTQGPLAAHYLLALREAGRR